MEKDKSLWAREALLCSSLLSQLGLGQGPLSWPVSEQHAVWTCLFLPCCALGLELWLVRLCAGRHLERSVFLGEF